MKPFVRKVKTSSGATAVQIVHKQGRKVVDLEHVGSAHDEAELAALLEVARSRIHAGQLELDLTPPAVKGRPAVAVAPVVVGTASQVLWDALESVYTALGFDAVADEAFKKLVLARVIHPVSKKDTIRLLRELGVPSPAWSTIAEALKRTVGRDYRDTVSKACFAHAETTGISLCLYDVTTLYFETDREDRFRKAGMSKERRLDPQIVIGLLVDQSGFPLEIHAFEGNKAEVGTMLPVIEGFLARHGLTGLTVVADAAMLSAANLNALEEAGLGFVVASRLAKTPYEIELHFATHGTLLQDGQIFETTRTMGTGRNARVRRVVYQYRWERAKLDLRNINKQIGKAEDTIAGKRALKKDKFLKITNKTMEVDWEWVDKARDRAGIKGYVTNEVDLPAQQVIDAYHALFQVERSFRMSKHDLAARPIYHRTRDSIEAHLTIVFTALAVSRRLQDLTGLSLKNVLDALRPLKSATLRINDHDITAPPIITPDAQHILDALNHRGGGH